MHVQANELIESISVCMGHIQPAMATRPHCQCYVTGNPGREHRTVYHTVFYEYRAKTGAV